MTDQSRPRSVTVGQEWHDGNDSERDSTVCLMRVATRRRSHTYRNIFLTFLLLYSLLAGASQGQASVDPSSLAHQPANRPSDAAKDPGGEWANLEGN